MENKRIFNTEIHAIMRASEIATTTKKILIVGMHCDTRKFHIMDENSPELMETTTEEMDGEEVELETYMNCINVHPKN